MVIQDNLHNLYINMNDIVGSLCSKIITQKLNMLYNLYVICQVTVKDKKEFAVIIFQEWMM
jgi:hypothetical protein